ncbi:conserved membrane protein of unknown function [Methylocella tundrae]|uniref:AI-2E family transporter n=1 Tax=Methylocella tundrae TaxID=227605 RepID=A0A4U8Z4X8_METTU|nr:conserved membrane protein of unknown function [Methylocella tundrae]
MGMKVSELFDAVAARPRRKRDFQRTIDMLATLVALVFSVGVLYIARDILVPIAIAVLLSFVLSQPILVLRRLGLPRVPAVMIVVAGALFIAFAASAALTRQVSELAVDLPKYQTTINGKISRLRDLVSTNAVFEKGATALKSIGHLDPARPSPDATPSPLRSGGENIEAPVLVEVRQPAPSPFAMVQTIVGTALSPLETAAIVVIFVIFILLQREDLRNRFIRLVGCDDLQRTTVAMNDAAGRLSRFFLTQTLVNAAFGVVVTAGLYMIGVPSPILFGIIAFLMRFVPYVGAIISASFPFALSAAVDPGWAMALETLALFLVLEILVGNFVEPLLYGRNTGLSPIAVVVSATFWTWLWGPIGLVLSTPLTVCLVVLGRHVDQLSFLDVILGDAPALTPEEHFYQRMLVGDASEVADQAEQFLKTSSLIAYYDDVALKGLLMAEADLKRGVLHEGRQEQIKETIMEVIENLSDHVDEPPAAVPEPAKRPYADLEDGPAAAPSLEIPPEDAPRPAGPRKAVLCIAGRNALDEAAAALLAQMLEKHGMEAKLEPHQMLTIGGILHLTGSGAQIICLSYLGGEVSAARVRYAIRRLRRRLPEARIIAAFWQCDPEKASELCGQTKADLCATRLAEVVAFCVAEAKAHIDSEGPTPADPRGIELREEPNSALVGAA